MAVSTAGMVARRRFGEALKSVREHAQHPDGRPVKQIDAAKAIKRKTIDRVSRFERGAAWPELEELEALLKLYSADLETSTRLRTMLREGQAIARAWWTEFEDEFPESLIEFVAYEDAAVEIVTCAGNVIPGLLQTPEYGRTLTRHLSSTNMTTDDVERSVELRQHRQRILSKDAPPAVEAIIGEAALRQMVGGVDVMRDQLKSLLDYAERGVTLRVVPFEVNATLTYMFHVFHFGGAQEKPVAAFDAMTGMSFRKDPKELRGLKGHVESLRLLALSPEDTQEHINTIRKEITRD